MANTFASLLLVDSYELVRKAVRRLIESFDSYRVVDEAGNFAEALSTLELITPDLIVLDIALQGASGVELIYELTRRCLPSKALVLSAIDSTEMVASALDAGALGYVLKTGSASDLEEGLRAVSRGERYVSRELRPLLLNGKLQSNSPNWEIQDPLEPLSVREREIFHLLANGLQNAAIAKQLFISPRTVETHRARVVRKLGFRSNAELIRFAIKHGLSVV